MDEKKRDRIITFFLIIEIILFLIIQYRLNNIKPEHIDLIINNQNSIIHNLK